MKRYLSIGMGLLAGMVLSGTAWGTPLFGPQRFERTTDAPQTQQVEFAACNPAATYRLKVVNGPAAGDRRVSAATVNLNGVDVVKANELNQKVGELEKLVTLQGNNHLDVTLKSAPGSFLTIDLACVDGCLDIEISSPVSGSSVKQGDVLIRGRLNHAFGETGVVLNAISSDGATGNLAQVREDLFAGVLNIQPGESRLTATATDACGYEVKKEISLRAETAQTPLRLSALPDNGVPAMTTGIFESRLRAEPAFTAPGTSFSWDFDGDGIIDRSGADLATVTAYYRQPGLYFPQVTITDSQGKTTSTTTVVNVASVEEMDQVLRTKWAQMTDALVKGEIEAAVAHFADASQERYRGLFTYIKSELPQLAEEMKQLELVYALDGRAKYRVRRLEGGQNISYFVYFHRLSDGIWKIYQL